MNAKVNSPRIIVALDYASEQEALHFIEQVNPKLCRLKVGSVMFTHYGPALIEKLMKRGFDVFLDLKFHDIPQTVMGACMSALAMGVWMMNVHASGGAHMMQAAVNAVQKSTAKTKPLLIAVTVLTSLEAQDLKNAGIQMSLPDWVVRLAKSVYENGLDGVVCSPQEVVMLRQQLPHDFLLVTPGIQLPDTQKADQKRVMTPSDAIKAGSDYLVIGRAITHSQNPAETLLAINADLQPELT